LARHVAVLTHDSLRERPTPSPALDQTARYVAAEFQRLGLRPGLLERNEHGRDSTWVQRYPLPGQHCFRYDSSYVFFEHPYLVGRRAGAVARFTKGAHFLPEVGPPVVVEREMNDGTTAWSLDWVRMGSSHTTLVAGRQTAAALTKLDVQNQVVLYVPPAGIDSAEQTQVLRALYATSAGVILVADGDSAEFAAKARAASQAPLALVDGYLRDATGPQRWPWAVAVWASALRNFLARSDVEVAALRADTTPRVQTLASTAVWLNPHVDRTSADAAVTAPNVLGLLEGADDSLKRQYVVVSAHMDGPGARSGGGGADSLAVGRGADDNAVGVAALLALAKAWSAPGARPKRSVLFVATSGTGPGQTFWGGNFAASSDQQTGMRGNGRSIVAALTLDRLGRLRGDSVLISGLKNIETPRPLWVAAAHPELGLQVIDADSAAVPEGDHFAWMRHNVPSLYLRGRGHGDADGAPDGRGTLDLAAAARVAQLVFYLGQEFAVVSPRPSWSDEGRRRYLLLQPRP
jgi:hypothetical protein